MDKPPHIPVHVLRAKELRHLGLPHLWIEEFPVDGAPRNAPLIVSPSKHGIWYFMAANQDFYE